MLLMDEAVSLLRRPDNGAGAHDQSLVQVQQHLKELWGLAIREKVPVFVVVTTNSPQDIDLHDFRRRLSTIVHVDLPNREARHQLWADGIKELRNEITGKEIEELAAASEGRSGFDIEEMLAQAQDDLWVDVSKATSFVPVSLTSFKQYHLLSNSLQVNYLGQRLEPARSSSAGGSKSYTQLDPKDQARVVYLPLTVSRLLDLMEGPEFETVTAAETQIHKDFQKGLTAHRAMNS